MDIDYFGNDLTGSKVIKGSACDCQDLCRNTVGCVQFTWIKLLLANASTLKGREGECWIKHTIGTSSQLDGVISGPNKCGKLLNTIFVGPKYRMSYLNGNRDNPI